MTRRRIAVSNWILFCFMPTLLIVLITGLVSAVLDLLGVSKEIVLTVAVFAPLLTVPLLISFIHYPGVRSTVEHRRYIPAWLRQAVLERDQLRCQQCGSENDLHLDHIIPWSKGGATSLENLQVLCRGCNLSKGDSW
jgi:hypothetical protein